MTNLPDGATPGSLSESSWESSESSATEPAPAGSDLPTQELVVISGMSGAGRSTAADVLEDLGWYVVDNLPPQLIGNLADLTTRAQPAIERLAVVLDVRGRSFFRDLHRAMDVTARRGLPARLLFLDASDEALVRRFESVRRPHPLQGDGTLLEGIRRERALLGDIRGDAHTVVDTSGLNVHELHRKLLSVFGDSGAPSMRLTVMSFGFKYGLPLDADLVADVRFLPNPHWVPDLRPRTGLDAAVSDYVLAQEGAAEFVERYVAALQPVLAGYVRENKRYATIAVGCTGGKHRSVAISERLAAMLRSPGVSTTAIHRDLGRE